MKRALFIFVTGIAMIIAGIVMGHYLDKKKSQPVGPAEIEVLAITEDSTKIYRVNHPKLIVPLVVVESKNGTIAIR